MSEPYRPIACALHDELQLRAMRRSLVSLRVRDDSGGGQREVRDRVVDVRTREGAEFLVLESGEEIRLDRLMEVDGIRFSRAP